LPNKANAADRLQRRLICAVQLTADQRAFNVFSVSFCEVIYNKRHQAAATDAGRTKKSIIQR